MSSHAPPIPQGAFEEAVAAHRAGRLAEATDGYRRVLQHNPRHADAWHLLGLISQREGDLGEAERLIRQALACGERPAFWANLGHVLKDTHRDREAEAAYRRALALQTDGFVAYHLGILLRRAGKTDEAEAHYRLAIQAQPGLAAAHQELGLLLHGAGRPAEAEAALRRALELNEADAGVHSDLALVLAASHRWDEAQAECERALQIDPGHAPAHCNLGLVHEARRRLPEAEAAYRRALALKPDLADAGFNLAVLLLAQGRFEQAWPLYEWRHAPHGGSPAGADPGFAFPRWRGEPLSGRSLVLWPEQGLGDYIQMARYAPLLKARGVSRLTLACTPALAPLLATVDGVDEVVTDYARLQGNDYWCFVMSLPLLLQVTGPQLPATVPYAHALPERLAQWQQRLPPARPRVGLVWRGNAAHKNDAQRSLPLASLAPLWSVPGVCFVSLQKGQGEAEAAHPPAAQPLVALGAQMNDFADAAALVAQMDLVICVDTAIAHVAGALGRPCWILLPALGTDWRWGLEAADSPWYPQARLFRQHGDGWGSTIDEVAGALRLWAAAFAADRA